MRPTGTQDELADLRRHAIHLLKEGQSVEDVAAAVGRTTRSVRRWWKDYQADGVAGIKAKRVPGRTALLTPDEQRQLRAMLRAGPEANGIPHYKWTAELIQLLISHQFGVDYHQNHISRLLARFGESVRDLNVERPWRDIA